MKHHLCAAAAVVLAVLTLSAPEQPAQARGHSTLRIAVVGDMACDTSNPDYNAGSGARNACQQKSVSNSIVAHGPWTAVLGLGDFQYDCDAPHDFKASYDPSYGRLDSFMNPTPGNHEYKTGTDAYGQACPTNNKTASGYFSRFSGSHEKRGGWYSFDLGSWHLVSLNANCQRIGGCSGTSPETAWLRSDLAATTQPCIAAFWHQPLYSGLKPGTNSAYKPWWHALHKVRADLVLNGHIHNYQRYAPMDASSTPRRNGITEYVVGTGGETEVGVAPAAAPQPAYWRKAFGFLRLGLRDTGWHSAFITRNGVAHDGFSGTCH